MGCLGSKEDENPKETEKPTYSWDRRERLDPKDYTISDVKGATTGRIPGTINGQQFFIQNCQDSNIFLLDHTASVIIDDCINCRVVIGPSKGSVFFRDCKECSCVVACQQFRTRDCKKMEIFLCCATQPIIESSTGMKFGCFSYYYPELEDQFDSAGLSVYNNNWSNVHDFTPAEGEATWTLLPEAVVVQEFIPLPETEQFKDIQISTDKDSSTVPITLGSRRKPYDESCLVLFFHDNNAKRKVSQFLNQLKSKSGVLVQSKEVRMKPEDVARIFQSDYYADAANRGPVISFEVNAKDSIQECKRITSGLSDDAIDSSVYVSPSPSKAAQDIDGFYNFVDMSMN